MFWTSPWLHIPEAITVMGFDHVDGSTPAALATAVAGAWDTSGWDSQMSTDQFLDRVEVRQGPIPGGAEASLTVGSPGLRAVTDVYPNCAVLVRKTSGLTGRANRGRMYLPGMLSEADVSEDGTIGAGVTSAIQTAMTAFYNALLGGAAAIQMVIFHTLPGPSPTLVTGLIVENMIATQRRRLRP
jgi:hypothetical protein